MFGTAIDRRKLVLLGSLALVAGCTAIPKKSPRPAPGPEDGLPSDKQRQRIALLVPTSGSNAALGQSISNAANMALLDTNAKTIRITTYDTNGGIAAAARKAMADGNRLVLGPVAGDQVAGALGVTRSAKVPVITYSGDAAVAARDAFVMGMTPEQSIDRVVSFAGARGMKRFALLAPKGDYGARATAAFTAAVRSAGGTVVASETYDRSNTSVVSAAQRIKSRGRFDAVLIADTPRFAALAAPRIKASGAASPRILGTELWSGDVSVVRTPALRGAWYAAISDSRFAQFSSSYKSRFGAAPYRQATYGYDSALLAIRVARDWKLNTPFPTARLTDRDGFLGLDGPFRFNPDGTSERALEVREVRAGGVNVVSAAPTKF